MVMSRSHKEIQVCSVCAAKKDPEDAIKNKLLPIWIDDDGTVRYDLPYELSSLSHAEKMLIYN